MGACFTRCKNATLRCITCGRFTGRVRRKHIGKEFGSENSRGSQESQVKPGRCKRLYHFCCRRSKRGKKHEFRRKRKPEDNFRLACARGQLKTIDRFLAKGDQFDIECATEGGFRGLHAAATNGSLSAVKALLQKKAEINATTLGGVTPLMLAAANGHKAVVEEFLRYDNIDVSLRAPTARASRQAQEIASGFGHHEIAEMIIKRMETQQPETNAVDADDTENAVAQDLQETVQESTNMSETRGNSGRRYSLGAPSGRRPANMTELTSSTNAAAVGDKDQVTSRSRRKNNASEIRTAAEAETQ